MAFHSLLLPASSLAFLSDASSVTQPVFSNTWIKVVKIKMNFLDSMSHYCDRSILMKEGLHFRAVCRQYYYPVCGQRVDGVYYPVCGWCIDSITILYVGSV